MQSSPRIWRNFDVWLLAAVALITIAGVAMISSAIAGNEVLAETVSRQTIYAIVGLVVVIATAAIDYRIWSALSRPLYFITIALLALIPLSGFVGFGSARWYQVGILTFQPSELAKILIILILADYLARQMACADMAGRSAAQATGANGRHYVCNRPCGNSLPCPLLPE